MTNIPDWPVYPTGPKDSIFALGVATIKFAELESILCFVFATVFEIAYDAATMIVAKIGAQASVTLVQQQVPKLIWPENGQEHLEHFIAGFCICLANRNHLAHSNMSSLGVDKPTLFKTSKQGRTLVAVPKAEELRQAADDMNAYCNYGRNLANAINVRKTPDGVPVLPFPWPDKPVPPHSMDYSPDPRPI